MKKRNKLFDNKSTGKVKSIFPEKISKPLTGEEISQKIVSNIIDVIKKDIKVSRTKN